MGVFLKLFFDDKASLYFVILGMLGIQVRSSSFKYVLLLIKHIVLDIQTFEQTQQSRDYIVFIKECQLLVIISFFLGVIGWKTCRFQVKLIT